MADNLKDELKPLINELRGLPGELGFRPYQVWARKTVWSGTHPGQGVRSTTDTRLLVGNGQDPKVTPVRRKDVVAGDKAKIDAEYDIGPLTPEFAGGGISEDTVNPQGDGQPTEILFVIKGPGMPSEGLLCARVSDQVDRPLRLVVRVKSIGRKA